MPLSFFFFARKSERSEPTTFQRRREANWSLTLPHTSAPPFFAPPSSPPLLFLAQVFVVKPLVGLSTPAVFKALDLGALSAADPLSLLGLHTTGAPISPVEPVPPSPLPASRSFFYFDVSVSLSHLW